MKQNEWSLNLFEIDILCNVYKCQVCQFWSV